jgi:hypothetical protein
MMTKEQKIKPEEVSNFFHRLNIIFYSLLGISMVAFVLLYLGMKRDGLLKNTFNLQTSESLMLTLPFLCVLTVPLAYVFYFMVLKKARNLSTLKEKLDGFKHAAITQYLVLFIGGALTVFLLKSFQEAVFAGVYCVIFFVFTVNRPSPEKIAKALKLKKEDFQLLNENRI